MFKIQFFGGLMPRVKISYNALFISIHNISNPTLHSIPITHISIYLSIITNMLIY